MKKKKKGEKGSKENVILLLHFSFKKILPGKIKRLHGKQKQTNKSTNTNVTKKRENIVNRII